MESVVLFSHSASGVPNERLTCAALVLAVAFLTGASLVGTASAASGPDPRIEVLERGSSSITYRVSVEWDRALSEALDPDASIGGGSASPSNGSTADLDAESSDRSDTLVRRLLRAVGGVREVTELVELGALERPGLTVEALGYDERPVELSSASAGEELAETFGREPAEIVRIGRTRGRPVGTLRARLLTFDPDRSVVRRYRHLRIRIDLPGTDPSSRLRSSAKTSNLTRSVLAEGRWFRIPITEEGIYRIDRAYLRDSLGLDPDAVDPASIGLYGNGGRPLPAANSAPRPRDLLPHPARARGGGDGSFDPNDAVWFFGRAPHGWDVREGGGGSGSRWSHYRNPFSGENAYFLRVDDPSPPRVRPPAGNVSDGPRIRRAVARRFAVTDEVNLGADGGSGLDWLSRPFSQGAGRILFDELPRPRSVDGPVRVRVRAAAQSPAASILSLRLNGGEGERLRIPAVLNSTTGYAARARRGEFVRTVPGGEPLTVSVRLTETGSGGSGYTDFAELFYPRRLEARRGVLRFHAPTDTSGVLRFELAGFAGSPLVWDVTEPSGIRAVPVDGPGPHVTVVDQEAGDAPRELIAFRPEGEGVRVPGAGTSVENQNLHGIQGYPDGVIVTPRAFRPAAEELAEFRRSQGLSVRVVEVEKIYNEFSGGVPDMRAVRDYLKFLYDRAPSEDRMIRYALLFGDGHVDYRRLTRPGLTNWIPPYETRESLLQIATYTSDDYFGLLDDEEGTWEWGGSQAVSSERVDVGVGRLPVQSLQEARAVVAKLIRYERPETFGGWRTRYMMVADDGPNGASDDHDLHTQNMEAVGPVISREADGLEQVKIYGQSYQAETTSEGRRIPGARSEMIRGLDRGVLVWNYTGHGSWRELAAEDLFTLEDVPAMTNGGRPTIGVTATCSWGHWDMPDRQSGAERMVLRPEGGAIAMLTTVRVVFTSTSLSSYNVGLNRALNEMMLQREEGGTPRRLGDVMRLTKNTRAGSQGNNRKFNLLGDPMTRVGLPRREVRITSVGGLELADTTARLPAMGRVTVEGEVRRRDGGGVADFDGEATVSVFDALRTVTLQPDQVVFLEDGSYAVQNDRIHEGRVRVEDGRFSSSFVVPRDISYSDRPGRVQVYAESAEGDGMGSTRRVRVGGTADDPVRDSHGPEVEVSLDDTTFVSGGLTGRTPELIVQLRDSSGLNVVGAGVGHETMLTIDGEEGRSIDIGSFFEGELGSSTAGTIRYPLPRQEEGSHTLRVTAWDVANNATTAELSYHVAPSRELTIRNVYNYPNPTSGPTRFIVEHNQPPGTAATVRVRIFTLSGRPVRTLERELTLASGPLQLPWDGRDEQYDPLGTGVYLYRVQVRVNRPSGERQVAERIEKVAIVR